MTYTIIFKALVSSGEVAAVKTFSIETESPFDMVKKRMAFERMCVEYARLTGVKCSFAKILNVMEGE